MKKYLITLLGLLLLVAAMPVHAEEEASVPEAPRFYSLADAQAVAAQENRNVIIDFYADWCKWCKRFDTVVLRDPKGIEYFSTEAVLVQINAEEDTAMGNKYGVMGFPTFVLLDLNGDEIDRIPGYLETDEFIQAIGEYKQGIGTLDALLEDAKTDNSRELAYEIGDKYKYRGMLPEAEEWFNKVTAVSAKDSLAGESRLAIADLYQRLKKYKQATPIYKAVATDFAGTPFEENADIWTAIVYKKAGDTTNAIAAFASFATKYPESEDNQYASVWRDLLTAGDLANKGETAKAIAAYEAFIQTYPNSSNLEFAKKEVERLKGTTSSVK